MGAAIDFSNQYKGQQLTDNHGNYWGECVSLVKRFSQEKQGVPNADSVLYVQGDLAKNMYLKPTDLQKQYYDTVSNNPIEGDIVVYGNPNDDSYGDVAVYVGNGQVFGQLGFPVYAPAATRAIGNPLGYVRFKGDNMSDWEQTDTQTKTNQIKLAYELALNKEPTDQQIQAQLGQPDLSHVLMSLKSDSAKAWAAAGGNATPLNPGIYKVN